MKNTTKVLCAFSLVAFAATSQAALKNRTKSNNPNERSTAGNAADAPTEDVSLMWGSDQPGDVHILSATVTPASGSEFSLGATNPVSSSSGMEKTGHVTLMKRVVAPGPGSMTILFDAAAAGGACPVAYDSLKPISGVGLVVKKNPGGSAERYTLDGVTVASCDASRVTLNYEKMSYDLAPMKKM